MLALNFLERFHFNESARVSCPFCSSERSKTTAKDLSLIKKPDGAILYHCHHCQVSGSYQPTKKEKQLSAINFDFDFELEKTETTKIHSVPNSTIKKPLEQKHYNWLQSRGISKATADKMKLFSQEKFFQKLSKTSDSIGFPYYRDGAFVAAKYRSFPEKAFTQEEGGAHDFFGLDNIVKGKPIIIVEGEIDCLTLIEAGVENVVSVPAGAPIKVSDGKVNASEDKKFSFIWNAVAILDAAPYVVLATDQDAPGQALAEELARRIGKDKCRLSKFDGKDLNEVWLGIINDPSRTDDPTRNRSEAVLKVKEIVEKSVAYPIAGLSDASVYVDRLNNLFNKGTGKGFSTGFDAVDKIYTVAPSQMTVVTGYPSSGKSNFVDQMMVNLAKSNDWKFAICSFENQPEIHISRLMEIYTKKRFFEGTDRMNDTEKDRAFKWVTDHFIFIDTNSEEPSTIESILSRTKIAIKRMGVRGLVIDPYNYIDLQRKSTETDAISDMLTKVQKFVKGYDLHCWFVAHPAKINRTGVDQPRPDGMSISGSMSWWAKTDNGITVHRKDQVVEIAVWKCRYRWVGMQGETTLLYNKTSGTYSSNNDHF